MISPSVKMQRVIFDFDNTLFETEALKDIFWQIALVHGYGKRAAQSMYQEARTAGDKIVIAIESYISVLKKHLLSDGRPYKPDEVVALVVEAENAQRLLPGARGLLSWCEENEIDRYLLSLGVAEWQERKVWHSGAHQFFPQGHIIYTDALTMGKTDVLTSLFGPSFTGEQTAFFDDKPDETATILGKYPHMLALVRREPRDERFEVKDFEELEQHFPGRVVWSTELSELQKVLETIV